MIRFRCLPLPCLIIVAVLALGLGACATKPPESDVEAYAEYKRINDPLEPLNRGVFKFNVAVDKAVLRPSTWVYRKTTPSPFRQVVANFFTTLEEPWTFVNDLLQGEPKRAGSALGRFLVNSTVGVGGLFDPATGAGLKRHEEDFGQTLAVWGVEAGPYVMLPFFGPSNLRDSVGLVAEVFGDPVGIGADKANVNNLQLSLTAGDVLDNRHSAWDIIEELYKSDDPYVTARSAFRQNRRFEITNGAVEQSEAEEELFDEAFEDELEDAPPAEPPTSDPADPQTISWLHPGPSTTPHMGFRLN